MALSQSQIDAIERPGYVAPVVTTTKKASVGSATKKASGGSSAPVTQTPIVQQTPTTIQTVQDKAATQPEQIPYQLSTAEQDRLDKLASVQTSPVTGIGNQKSAQELATEQAIATKQATDASKAAQTVAPVQTTAQTSTPAQTTVAPSETESAKMYSEAIANVNAQIQQISSEVFDYNPLSDSQYLRDAANLENQITQMMVGRGGLYSSVANNALSSQMISLQNNYMQNKYTEFKDNRTFQLQLAQQNFENAMSVASAVNTQEQQALDQAWKQLEFQVEQEEKAYQRQQDANEYNLKVAQLNYEISSAKAQAEAQQNIANVQAQYSLYADAKTNLEKQVARWQKSGTSDASIVSALAALGVTVPVGANISYYANQITTAYYNLSQSESALKLAAVDANDTVEILDLLDALNNPTTQQEVVSYTYDSEGRRTSSTTKTENVSTTNYTTRPIMDK